MQHLHDLFKVNYYVIDTPGCSYHFASFLGGLGISGKYRHWATERVQAVTDVDLECQLVQASWD